MVLNVLAAGAQVSLQASSLVCQRMNKPWVELFVEQCYRESGMGRGSEKAERRFNGTLVIEGGDALVQPYVYR
jgi:hypothetical protein